MWWAQLLNVIAGIHGTGVAASTTSYESIATVTVGSGGQASATFTSIPSTYKHLQIRYIGSSDSSVDGSYNVRARLNSDSSASYSLHLIDGNGSSASATGVNASIDHMYIGNVTSSFSGFSLANAFGASVIDILDYANTNKNTTSRILNGYDINGSGKIQLISNLWNNTAAVTSISIFPQTGNWRQYSQFALYGIKG